MTLMIVFHMIYIWRWFKQYACSCHHQPCTIVSNFLFLVKPPENLQSISNYEYAWCSRVEWYIPFIYMQVQQCSIKSKKESAWIVNILLWFLCTDWNHRENVNVWMISSNHSPFWQHIRIKPLKTMRASLSELRVRVVRVVFLLRMHYHFRGQFVS